MCELWTNMGECNARFWSSFQAMTWASLPDRRLLIRPQQASWKSCIKLPKFGWYNSSGTPWKMYWNCQLERACRSSEKVVAASISVIECGHQGGTKTINSTVGLFGDPSGLTWPTRAYFYVLIIGMTLILAELGSYNSIRQEHHPVDANCAPINKTHKKDCTNFHLLIRIQPSEISPHSWFVKSSY